MRRRVWLGAALLVGLVGASAASALEIAIVSPEPGQPVFGVVRAEVEIYPWDAPVERVELFVDGQFVEMRRQAPWSFEVDVGQENRSHEFYFAVFDPGGESGSASLRTPRIRTDEEVEVELQQLYVTVETGDGSSPSLGAEDFVVEDNGERQDLVTFERGDIPFTAVLAVDASVSMKGRRLRIALDGARAFAAAMKPLDEAKLLVFSDRSLHETPFTSFAGVLGVGLAGIEAAGGTALNDFLFTSMIRLEQRQGRRVVVLLSDGIDVHSVLSMKNVRQTAGVSQAVLYWIRLLERGEDEEARHVSFWRDSDEHALERRLLRETVEESGGRVVTISSIEEVGGAFARVLRELREQYVLGYYASDAPGDGRWHRVSVDVRGGGHRVRVRRGYFDLPNAPGQQR
jgi:VWFA-related protein